MNIQRLALIALAAFALAGCSSTAESKEKPATGPTKSTAVAGSKTGITTAVEAKIGEPAPTFTLKDADGKVHNLADYKGKYVVLEWINFGCPFVVRQYGDGLMPATQAAVAGEDLVWLSINTSKPGKEGHLTGEALSEKMAAMHWAGSAYLMDADGAVGRSYGAKTTPHMYIVGPEGDLIFMGAIDDSPQGDAITVNYIEAAMKSARAGEEIAVKSNKSYGCGVKY